jgi:hypothetical protein
MRRFCGDLHATMVLLAMNEEARQCFVEIQLAKESIEKVAFSLNQFEHLQ